MLTFFFYHLHLLWDCHTSFLSDPELNIYEILVCVLLHESAKLCSSFLVRMQVVFVVEKLYVLYSVN